MGRLTFRPLDISYWDDKLILKHPSETPSGYKFLFTHSDPSGRCITGSAHERTVIDDRGNAHSVGGTPTHWTNHYTEYDVYMSNE